MMWPHPQFNSSVDCALLYFDVISDGMGDWMTDDEDDGTNSISVQDRLTSECESYKNFFQTFYFCYLAKFELL